MYGNTVLEMVRKNGERSKILNTTVGFSHGNIRICRILFVNV